MPTPRKPRPCRDAGASAISLPRNEARLLERFRRVALYHMAQQTLADVDTIAKQLHEVRSVLIGWIRHLRSRPARARPAATSTALRVPTRSLGTPTLADLEAMLAQYPLPGDVSTLGPGAGPTDPTA